MSSLRFRGEDVLDDLLRSEVCGVNLPHRKVGVGVSDAFRSVFAEDVPARYRLVTFGQATPAFVLRTDQLVGDRPGEVGRQCDAEADAESVMVSQAPGEVAFHHHWVA